MATHILADGLTLEAVPANGKSFTLEELQGFVGGYIERLVLPTGQILFLDEEGKLKGKAINPFATFITRGIVADEDMVVGDVILCTPEEAGEDG